MSKVDWDEFAKAKSFRAVIDPSDSNGIKNSLIDQIHWNAISRNLKGSVSILDFGCGIGRFAKRPADRNFEYCGIDTSIGMINRARQVNVPGKVEFIHSSRLPLPFSDGKFSACLSVWVLQYLVKLRFDSGGDVFSELARIVSPGGQLLIIEQATASGRSSGTVEAGSTEKEYVQALSDFFHIERLERIRCSKTTKLSQICLRYGKHFLNRAAIDALARLETQHALTANVNFLRGIDYYDICISAVKR